jgi:hypothetical protein
MGTRGPVPQRTDQRRRRNKNPDGATTRGPGAPRVKPPTADAGWHQLAQDYFSAAAKSGQSAWYEPSDWQHLRVSCEVLSRMLVSGRLSAQLYAAWAADSSRLLVTEGDRRRVRLELDRKKAEDPDKAAGVASMDEWRERLGTGS